MASITATENAVNGNRGAAKAKPPREYSRKRDAPEAAPLPHNLEAEQSVIGAMLIEREAVETAITALSASDFYYQSHRIIFANVAAMQARGDATDLITVAEELRRHNHLGDENNQVSVAYLSACIEACPTASSVVTHGKIVRELSQKRWAFLLAEKARGHAMNGVAPAVAVGEIRKSLDALEAEIEVTAPPSRFPRIGLAEVFARPRLEHLIQDVLLERGTGVLSADYGAYKSFLALSMGLCIATGMDWHGRKTKRGTVVYVIAEGAYTTSDRARAFLIRHQIEAPENFHIIETPAQIGEMGDCDALISELAEIEPAFIVFDTLAKCNLGRDENDTAAMTMFTHGMERIAGELGAFVLAIHHNNKNGTARGAVALPANVDTHIVLKPKGQRIVTVECDKQKGAPFESFALVGRVVELPEIDEYGRPVTSLVFDETDAPENVPTKTDASLEQVYQSLATTPDGLRASEWQKRSGLSSSRFYDFRDLLLKAARVEKDGLIYKVTPITPITPNRSQSEGENNSDYSDDALASEQSEYSEKIASEQKHRSKSKRRGKNDADSEPYAVPPDEGDEVTV